MRTVKFKAFWIDQTYPVARIQWFSDGRLRRFTVYCKNVEDIDESKWLYPRDDIVLRESTGLKDKNGVEIYEGDIIARYWSDGSILQQFEVKWFDDKAGYAINPDLLSSTRHNQQTGMTAHGFEIIGHIYENPELLSNKEVRG